MNNLNTEHKIVFEAYRDILDDIGNIFVEREQIHNAKLREVAIINTKEEIGEKLEQFFELLEDR